MASVAWHKKLASFFSAAKETAVRLPQNIKDAGHCFKNDWQEMEADERAKLVATALWSVGSIAAVSLLSPWAALPLAAGTGAGLLLFYKVFFSFTIKWNARHRHLASLGQQPKVLAGPPC